MGHIYNDKMRSRDKSEEKHFAITENALNLVV